MKFLIKGYVLILFTALAASGLHSQEQDAVQVIESWKYRWGDTAAASGSKNEWFDGELSYNIPGRDGDSILWLRTNLPPGNWKEPVLYLSKIDHYFQVYIDGEQVYKYTREEMEASGKKRIHLWYTIPLKKNFEGKTLELRIWSDHRIGVMEVLIGDNRKIIDRIATTDLDQLILGSLFAILGLTAFGIAVVRKTDRKLIIPFALLSSHFGLITLMQTEGVQGIEWAGITYLDAISVFLLPATFCYFFEKAFGAGYRRLVRRLWQVHLAYGVTVILLATWVRLPYEIPFFLLTVLTLLFVVGTALQSGFKGDKEARIFTIGVIVFVLFLIRDVLVGLDLVPGWKLIHHWGAFVFIGSVGVILERRFEDARRLLRVSREELRKLAGHLQDVRESERAHIAREIHDELGQYLTGLKMDVAIATDQIKEQTDGLLREALLRKLGSTSELIDKTVQSVRKIASDLRPIVLDNLGLLAAIEWQVEEFQSRTGIISECHLTADAPDLGRDRSTGVFRILQESLTNVLRHSGASRVTVEFGKDAGSYFMEIKDNGSGIRASDLHKSKSFGVIGIKERALLLGGEARVTGEPGQGTTVSVTIPINHSENKGASS